MSFKIVHRHLAQQTMILLDKIRKCLPNVCLFYQLNDFHSFVDLPMAKLINVAKMVSVMHEADHTYSIQSTL